MIRRGNDMQQRSLTGVKPGTLQLRGMLGNNSATAAFPSQKFQLECPLKLNVQLRNWKKLKIQDGPLRQLAILPYLNLIKSVVHTPSNFFLWTHCVH